MKSKWTSSGPTSESLSRLTASGTTARHRNSAEGSNATRPTSPQASGRCASRTGRSPKNPPTSAASSAGSPPAPEGRRNGWSLEHRMMCSSDQRSDLALRGAAGELDVAEPGRLRDEAGAEEAGVAAEVAGPFEVVDREPVDALQPPFGL